MESPKRMKRNGPPAPLHLKNSNNNPFAKLESSAPKAMSPNHFLDLSSGPKDWDSAFDPAMLSTYYSPLTDAFDATTTTHIVPSSLHLDEPLTSPLYLSKSSSSGSHSPSLDSESHLYSIQRSFTPEDSASDSFMPHQPMMDTSDSTWNTFMDIDSAYPPPQNLMHSPMHQPAILINGPNDNMAQPLASQSISWDVSFDNMQTSFFTTTPQQPPALPLSSSVSLHHQTPRHSRASVSKPSRGSISKNARKPRRSPYSPGTKVKTLTPSSSTPSSNGGGLECVDCNIPFRDLSTLQKHVKAEHTRPLICVFHWAGCTSRFASKNEWKRHVVSQHLALKYWICTEGGCGEITAGTNSKTKRSASLPDTGCIFNRKDLYTQHIRRMHVNVESSSGKNSGKKNEGRKGSASSCSSESDDYIRQLQERATRIRCELPTYMICPATNCNVEFHGRDAWDERMEHVAGHLDRAAMGEEPTLRFGGLEDWTLTNWAEKESVEVVKRTGTGWRLCNPLRGDTGNPRGGAARKPSVVTTPLTDEDEVDGEDFNHQGPWSFSAAGSARK